MDFDDNLEAYKRLKKRSMNLKYVFRELPQQEVNCKILMIKELINKKHKS